MGQIGVSRKVDPEEAIDTSAKRARQEGIARLPGEIRYDTPRHKRMSDRDVNSEATIDTNTMNNLWSGSEREKEKDDDRRKKK